MACSGSCGTLASISEGFVEYSPRIYTHAAVIRVFSRNDKTSTPRETLPPYSTSTHTRCGVGHSRPVTCYRNPSSVLPPPSQELHSSVYHETQYHASTLLQSGDVAPLSEGAALSSAVYGAIDFPHSQRLIEHKVILLHQACHNRLLRMGAKVGSQTAGTRPNTTLRAPRLQ